MKLCNSILFLYLFFSATAMLRADFNFNGGTVSGGSISGQVSAEGTSFNNVKIDGSGDFKNCSFAGCVLTSSEAGKNNPQNADHAKSQGAVPETQAPAPAQNSNASSQVKSSTATPAPALQSSSTTQSGGVKIGPRSGVPMVDSSESQDVKVDNSSKPESKSHSAFVTIPGAEKYRSPKSESVRKQNFQNQIGLKEHLKENNPYASAEKINPSDLDNVSNLPKRAPRPGIAAPSETYKTDWEMGMLKLGEGGVLYDKWGNRVGVSMYDKKYRDQSQEKHSGNHFIYFDEDYKVGGAVIVPKGYYKSLNSGYIFDSSGEKVGEMLSSGEIRWPEFMVDIDPEKYKAQYANQKHF